MICNLGLGPVVARSDARFLLPVLAAATIPWGVVQLRSAHAIASEDLRRIITTPLAVALLMLTCCCVGMRPDEISGASSEFSVGSMIVVFLLNIAPPIQKIRTVQ